MVRITKNESACMPRVRKPCPHAAPHRIQTQLISRCTALQVYVFFKFPQTSKKITSLAYDMQKN